MKVKIRHGTPLLLGATPLAEGINFAIFSRHGKRVSLLLFCPDQGEKVYEVELDPAINRTGDVWHIMLCGIDASFHYGYRVDGPFEPQRGHYFQDHILLDPYARALSGGSKWAGHDERRGCTTPESKFSRRGCIVENNFDWQGDRPLNIPLQDSIIYELHVRGFTCDPSSGVSHPGTFAGIIEKIPYLQELGVTAVELMPVTEFNENENTRIDPLTSRPLKNYWGYSPISFFAPKASYAVNGVDGNQVREFKEMVLALHQAGIEVILDIVFNHTAEGGAGGPVYSFRGLDNSIYYLLGQEGEFLNFSGCGNTLNCNHPLVRNLIMDVLRYWVVEMHVDGFRFDLASILGRDSRGEVLSNPPVVEQIAEDPVLANTKIIAEAWDAAGLYQVGSFSSHIRWAEWNGRFRDDVRAFSCGKPATVAALATRIGGSSDLYQPGRQPANSINFLTSHDGFTLMDLVSYAHKHNLANGEENQDGCDYNISWNSGVEGLTDDPEILALRRRRIKTMAVILMLSQGTPMLLAGDEFGRSQQGNNNAYCQDNEISWLNWQLAEDNSAMLRFFRYLISLRKGHRVFRRIDFFSAQEGDASDIRWQYVKPGQQNWSSDCKALGFFLDGGGVDDSNFFIALNCGIDSLGFVLPPAFDWRQLVDTAGPEGSDIYREKDAPPVSGSRVEVASMGAAVFIADREKGEG